MGSWIKTFQIIFAVYFAVFAIMGKAEAATTIYQIEVADNNGFTQIRGTLSVPTNMQFGSVGTSFASILNRPSIELFGLSEAGEIYRLAIWLPIASPVSYFNPSATTGTRLWGAIGSIETPLSFAEYLVGDPDSIFTNFNSGGGLVIHYSGIYQEFEPLNGTVYPTLRLSGARILSVTSAVPEPQTWATFLLGFMLIGAAMRYRSRKGNRIAVRSA